MSPIRFASKIYVLPREAFKARLSPNRVEASPIGTWKIQYSARCVEASDTYSASCCLAGGIQNQQLGTMFHMTPAFKPGEVRALLEVDAHQLRQSGKPLRGLITGGDSSKYKIEAVEALESIFKDLGIPYSLLLGQLRWGGSDVYMEPKTDTWLISPYRDSDPENPCLCRAELEKAYERVEIAPDDELILVPPQPVLSLAVTAQPVPQVGMWSNLLKALGIK